MRDCTVVRCGRSLVQTVFRQILAEGCSAYSTVLAHPTRTPCTIRQRKHLVVTFASSWLHTSLHNKYPCQTPKGSNFVTTKSVIEINHGLRLCAVGVDGDRLVPFRRLRPNTRADAANWAAEQDARYERCEKTQTIPVV